ncbi:MAG: hypothetical protein V5A77_07280, partial [Candidatus Bipolaricaulota bacterium]
LGFINPSLYAGAPTTEFTSASQLIIESSRVKNPAPRDGACRKAFWNSFFGLLQTKTQQSIEPNSWTHPG